MKTRKELLRREAEYAHEQAGAVLPRGQALVPSGYEHWSDKQRIEWLKDQPDVVTMEEISEAAASSFPAGGTVKAGAKGLVDDVIRVGPKAGGLVDDVVRVNRHHTVPREILKILPEHVANDPLVRGIAGAPNRWPIPEHVHKAIHKGPGGGAYNEWWKAELKALGPDPEVSDVLRIRDRLTKQFGIDIYRP